MFVIALFILICFCKATKFIRTNLEDKLRRQKSDVKKLKSKEPKSNDDFGIKYLNESKSSKINVNQSIKPCKVDKEGIICNSYSEIEGNKMSLKSSNERLLKLPNQHYNDRNKTLVEKFRRGKLFSKRDVEGKDNDPWSIISPVGKYKNKMFILFHDIYVFMSTMLHLMKQ